MRREWIRVCKSADPLWSRAIMGWLWFIFKLADEISLWIRNTSKIFFKHANSKIRAKKMVESAIRCHWQINKSGVKISLWIRNLSKNIFKIRRSVGLFIRQWAFMRLRVCLNYSRTVLAHAASVSDRGVQGRGPGGPPPLIFRPNWGPKGHKKPFLRLPGFFGAGVNIISLLSVYLASSPREFNTVLYSWFHAV